MVTLATLADAAGVGAATIAYFASALLVTSRSSLLVTSWSATILIVIAASLTAVGVPLIVIFAVVSSVRLTLWLKPAGRLVIQLPLKAAANVSFTKVMVTSCSVISAFCVPLIVTLPTLADTAGADADTIAYFASALLVTSRSSLLVTSWSATILIVIAASLTAVGVPLIVIFAVVSSVRLTLWLKPAGRLVIQLPLKAAANVSFTKVMVTSCSVISAFCVPLIVTLPTLAVVPSANAMVGMKHAIIMMLMSIANSFFISFSFLFTVGLCFVCDCNAALPLGDYFLYCRRVRKGCRQRV